MDKMEILTWILPLTFKKVINLYGLQNMILDFDRQLNNIQYATNKREIQSHGLNVCTQMENCLKETLHIYGYIFAKNKYPTLFEQKGIEIRNNTTFGNAIYFLSQLNHFLRDNQLKERFNKYFNRNYVVIRPCNDPIYRSLKELKELRNMIAHDLTNNLSSIDVYKSKVNQAIRLALDIATHFKDGELFPAIVKFVGRTENQDFLLYSYEDEVGKIYKFKTNTIVSEEYIKNPCYTFYSSKQTVLIPTHLSINNLGLEKASSNIRELSKAEEEEEKTAKPFAFLKNSQTGELYILNENNELNAGRSRENNVVLKQSSISRKHFSISINQNKAILKDMGSSYGTYLNNKKITSPIPLNHQDEIKIGVKPEEVVFIYEEIK